MKKLLFVWFLVCLFLYSCTKSTDIAIKSDYSPMAGRSIWPTTISLGEDLILPKTDSICLIGYSAFLSTCGTAPETEAPLMGTRIWQMSGPSQLFFGWYNGKPTIKGFIPGTYTVVGSAWVIGYRSCDDSTMNDQAYDTVNITILKRKAMVK